MLNERVRQRRPDLLTVSRALALAWVVLSLADASVTYLCLQDTANIEGNPLARALLSHNEVLFYGAKLGVTFGVGLGFWWLAGKTRHLKAMISCQILLAIMFIGVLANNALHL